jgi:hypothetical protein
MSVGPALFGGAGATGPVALNPADKNANISLALSGSNLIAEKVTSDGTVSIRATRGIASTDSGYFEVYVLQGAVSTFMAVGLSTTSLSTANYAGFDTNSWGYYQDTGQKVTNGVFSAHGTSWKVNGDVVMVAFKNGSLWFGKNGTWVGNPAANTGAAFTGITGTLYPTLCPHRGSTAPDHRLAFRPHAAVCSYAAPSGFNYWQY